MRRWFVVLAFVLGACSGFDPNAGLFPRDGGASASGASASGGDAGLGDDTGGAVDPFAGAPAFQPGQGGGSVVGDHLEEIGRSNAGTDCFASGCHGSTGERALLFGGTVYTDPSGTTPAVGVEIRVVDANGNPYSTYSDADGNFYVRGSGGLPLVAHAGARDANGTSAMFNDVTAPGCNSCHDGNIQARIFAP